MLECVVNISEGRNQSVIDAIAGAAGPDVLDVHTDPHHHRSVLTLLGEEAPRRVAAEAVRRLDLGAHSGVHPRIGVVDVVPFVPLDDSTLADACAARDRFGDWAGSTLGVPCFFYGPERTLPDIRREAFGNLPPDHGPPVAHPTAGAIAVGCRPMLVAYNVWLSDPDLDLARSIARAIRSPTLRALGLQVGDGVQVSMNLVDPLVTGPGAATDLVRARAEVERCELVGLLPRAVLEAEDPGRWDDLDLSAGQTIESRRDARVRRSRPRP